MSIEQLEKAAAPLRAARARQMVARWDYLRGVRGLAGQATQVELARVLGISQPAVSKALKEESSLPAVPAGFHGGSPAEIIARFTAGEITREQIIDELLRWPYKASDELEGPWDDLLVTVPGSFDDVEDAVHQGLLPGDVYDEILRRYNAVDTAS
jgi:DNA-binding transcriptional regulator YdaS (Cro superfamily)